MRKMSLVACHPMHCAAFLISFSAERSNNLPSPGHEQVWPLDIPHLEQVATCFIPCPSLSTSFLTFGPNIPYIWYTFLMVLPMEPPGVLWKTHPYDQTFAPASHNKPLALASVPNLFRHTIAQIYERTFGSMVERGGRTCKRSAQKTWRIPRRQMLLCIMDFVSHFFMAIILQKLLFEKKKNGLFGSWKIR